MVPAREADILSALPDLQLLWNDSLGDPEIVIGVLDGPVDTSHPCFQGANLTHVETLVPGTPGGGRMTAHGTHVASLIFGQPGGPITGIAPRCRGLIAPVFRDDQSTRLSQLDLARAIEQAVQAGAHVINVSGGELAPEGQADSILARAVRLCDENGVLLVAATGNDGCQCLHVPAALPTALAVGALGQDGWPLESSNWGAAYSKNGVLAPGENILGAVPGGGTASFTGSSFATPIVSGVAALLVSIQKRNGRKIDPLAAGEAILEGARSCRPSDSPECRRFLAGTLNIPGAYALIQNGGKKTMSNPNANLGVPQTAETGTVPAAPIVAPSSESGVVAASVVQSAGSSGAGPTAESAVTPSSAASAQPPTGAPAPATGCGCGGGKKTNVFALGTISFDFGTEARRDSFRQLMPYTKEGYPPNPYDVVQLCNYLDANHAESTKLIWTLNLDATPIYAIEAEVAYADDVYTILRSALRNEALKQTDDNYVGRVSVPGLVVSRTVRLFSGQVIPVVVTMPRGLYTWNEQQIIAQVKKALPALPAGVDPGTVDVYLRNFLNKVYYEFRNLGVNPQDRALNYSATNLFQLASSLPQIINPTSLIPNVEAGTLYAFDTISVSKSPYCRMDSDCWDVQLTFFDPTNDQSANIVMQFTVDVSDTMPVTLGPTRMWTSSPI